MPFGIFDTEYIDLPSVIDRTYVENLQTASGTEFSSVLRDIDERIRAFNSTFDPLVAAISYETQESFIEYAQAVAFDVQEAGEYTMGRMQRGELAGGWMLPVRKWDVVTGWTEDGLREMRTTSILNNLDGILLGLRTRFKKEVIRRFFSDLEVPVEYGRTTATSPGFAGSGTGQNVYSRPFPNGAALPGGYTHYIRTDSAGLDAALLSARDKLVKMQIPAPYDLIAPQAQIDAIKLSPYFVKTGSPLIRAAPSAAEALVDPALYVGVFGDLVRVRIAIDDFTSPNIAVFKTYGQMDPRNPIAIRFPDTPGLPDGGRSAYLRSRSLSPLDAAQVISRWGVGVGNRVAAVLLSVAASGAYTPPTLT